MSAPAHVTVAAAAFASQEEASRAVEALRAAGFPDTEIGVVPGEDLGCRSQDGITFRTGAAVGGMVGASAGGLAGGPVGLLAGALAGGLLGALIDLGIPEDAACFYGDEQQAGRTVVFVRSARAADAAALLRDRGAKDVRRWGDAGEQL